MDALKELLIAYAPIISAGVMVFLGILWANNGRKKLEGKLTEEQLQAIDFIVIRAVESAEQLFLTGKIKDRKLVALNFARDLLDATDIIPELYEGKLDNLIEAAVYNLPETGKAVE